MGDVRATCVPKASDCAVGCNATNTTAAPADGLITAFSVPNSGVQNGVIAGPAEAAPIFTTDGALRIRVDTPALSTAQLFGVHYGFPECVDATAFTGVQFSIRGSLSGCTFGEATQDSAHQPAAGGSATGADRHGSGGPESVPNTTALTGEQITSNPQTLQIPFAAQSNGVPATPTDKSKITDVAWVFLVQPYAVDGPTACRADLTIADVGFY
jgi:hypothetical protein